MGEGTPKGQKKIHQRKQMESGMCINDAGARESGCGALGRDAFERERPPTFPRGRTGQTDCRRARLAATYNHGLRLHCTGGVQRTRRPPSPFCTGSLSGLSLALTSAAPLALYQVYFISLEPERAALCRSPSLFVLFFPFFRSFWRDIFIIDI